jgi:VanZ family protein
MYFKNDSTSLPTWPDRSLAAAGSTAMQSTRSLEADRAKRLASRARTLALFYFLALCIGTHIPSVSHESISDIDKVLHFSGYAGLTLLVLIGWELTIGVLEPKHYFAVWLAGTLYGALDEWTQIPVRRTCDMNDWLADVLGIVCGLVLFRLGRGALGWFVAPSDGALACPADGPAPIER